MSNIIGNCLVALLVGGVWGLSALSWEAPKWAAFITFAIVFNIAFYAIQARERSSTT